VRRLPLIFLWICAACGGDDQAAPPPHAAGHEAADHDDAGQAPSNSTPADAHFSVTAFLLEIERGTFLTCPCSVQRGEYPSMQDCVEKVSFKPGWQACVAGVELPGEEADVSARLRCALAELQHRNNCLEPAPCTSTVMALCQADTLHCPKLDPGVLTAVIDVCHASVMLWH
jgi:hypothetical protein